MKKKSKHLPVVNDEGVEVALVSSGINKHGDFPVTETTSDSVTVNMDWNNEILPIDGEDYGDNRSSEFFKRRTFIQRIIDFFRKN